MERLRTDPRLLPPELLSGQYVCMDNLRFLAGLPDASMKLILTSPPYNVGKRYGGQAGADRLSFADYVAGQRVVITEAARLLAPGGSICWQVGNHVQGGEVMPLDIILYPLFKDLGLIMRGRIVWTYGHGLHGQRRFSGRHETVLWFTREEYTFNLDAVRVPSKYPGKRAWKGPRKGELSGHPLGKNPGDVWDIPNVKANHVEKTEHPCQFPVEVAERLVLALTDAGDAVLDPYAGVATTLVAAEMHGRRGFGCELVGDYVVTGKARVRAARAGTLRTRPRNTPPLAPPPPSI